MENLDRVRLVAGGLALDEEPLHPASIVDRVAVTPSARVVEVVRDQAVECRAASALRTGIIRGRAPDVSHEDSIARRPQVDVDNVADVAGPVMVMTGDDCTVVCSDG